MEHSLAKRGKRRPVEHRTESLGETLDSLQESFVICDSADRIVFANSRFKAMNAAVEPFTRPGTVYSRFLEAGLAEGLFPAAKTREREWLEEALARRRGDSGWPVEYQRRGGTWWLANRTRLPDGGSITVGVEITARKAAEETLRQGDSRFRAIFEQAAVGIAVRGLDGRWLEVNQKLCEILGYTRAELLGTTSVLITPPEDRAEALEYNEQMASGRISTYTREKRYLRRDGVPIWVGLTMNVVRAPDGTPQHVISVIEDISARKAAQEQAKFADERLRLAIEHLNESVAVTDAQDRILVTNRRFRELNGATGLIEPGRRYEEHLRAGIPIGNYPEAKAQGERWLAERLARRRMGGTIELRRQDGIWLRVTDQHLPDGGIITFALDITSRKEAELALAESEARFRDFAGASAEWFWETDSRGRFSWLSKSLEAFIGERLECILGKERIAHVSYGADLRHEPWASHLRAVARHEPFRDLRYPRRGPRGERWISSSGTPRFGDAGEFLGYRGAGSDVTERVEVEHRARLAEERLRAALENLGEMIVLTDAEDRIVLANRRFVEFNAPVAEYAAPGRRYDEHLRAGIALGLFPDAAGREEQWLAERMALRRAPSGPVERRRQDGRWLLVDDQRLPGGGIISFGLEITERKRAEETLRDINAELERRVLERTAELKAAYQELESFSYSVSHDLRAPLRAICGFASILRDEEGASISEEGRRYLSVIDGSAQQMGRLVDALLELVRLSRRPLSGAHLDMAALAREVADEFGANYPRARIEIGLLPAAAGDITLVRQVFSNLIGNALKYSSRADAPQVEIGAEPGTPQPRYFVRDNGVGFDMAYVGKLFRPFERLHADADFKGTGIGLALVQLILERHGGRIWADGAPGKGATFRFTLGARARRDAAGAA